MATEEAAGARRPGLRRPNLVPIAPSTFYGPITETNPNYAFGGGAVVEGCTPDEVVRKAARRCLRFDTILANRGRGPLEVAYQADAAHGILSAYQRVYRNNGTYKSRFAVATEFHPTHGHFHIKDFYVARLWRVDARGRPRGKRPVARGDKNGFCPEDSTPTSQSSTGPHYHCYSTNAETSGAVQVVGISPGWADLYTAWLPDQYLEISGVRDGRYLFELEIDPHDVFVESSEKDNSVCVLMRLDSTSAGSLGKRDCPP